MRNLLWFAERERCEVHSGISYLHTAGDTSEWLQSTGFDLAKPSAPGQERACDREIPVGTPRTCDSLCLGAKCQVSQGVRTSKADVGVRLRPSEFESSMASCAAMNESLGHVKVMVLLSFFFG